MLGTVILATATLPLLLYLPGLVLERALLPQADALERHYERVIISALLSGWLALLLASLGLFSLWLHLTLLLLLTLLAWRVLPAPPPTRSSYRRWEVPAFALIGLLALLLVLPPFEVILGARDAAVYANTGFAIARTGGLVQYDPLLAELGQQAQSDYAPLRDPAQQALSNFLGVQNPERFIATRLYTAGFMINEGEMPQGRIVPQHLHLTPAWIALLTSVLGLAGGLFAPGLLGVLGAWSVGMLGRRLAGGPVGALAFLLLALNSVQVWFARYPTSETTAQFLIFAGLYCFAKFQHAQEQQRGSAPVYAALAGVAIGQVALARIDFFLSVGPLLLYLLYCAIARHWRASHTALALGLGAMLLHAGLHILFIARAYFFDTAFARLQDYALTSYFAQPFITPLLREVYHTTNRSPFKDPWLVWREIMVLLAVLGLLLALWNWPPLLRWLEAQLRRWRQVLATAVALTILLLAGYAYFIRPQILTPTLLAQAPGCLLPDNWQVSAAPEVPAPAAVPLTATDTLTVSMQPPAAAAPVIAQPCLTLQGYVGAPIDLPPPPPGLDEKYMIPLANFVRFGWYLSPLGIILGVAGFALWWLRGLQRNSWLFLVVGLLGTFFFVRDTYGTSDQSYIYILRRFVPIAYPAFSLSMAYGLVALAGVPWAAAPRPLRYLRLLASGGLALLLLAFFAWTGRPIFGHVEYDGAVQGLAQVADSFEPDDVLLLRGGAPTYGQARDIPDLVATPLRFTFGLNALVVKSGEPGNYADALAAQVRRWQAEGRGVYLLLSASGGNFTLPGFALEPAGAFRLSLAEYEQLTDQKPRNIARLNLAFAVYRLREAAPGSLATLDLPLEASDFAAQVRGFYLPEPGGDAAQPQGYAWTDGDALLRIPWQAGQLPAALTLRVAGGQRPPHLGPAHLCLSIAPEDQPWPATTAAFVPLGCFEIADAPAAYRIPLEPDSLPTAASGSALLRLHNAAWVPAQEDPRQHDQRPVGVQFLELRE